MSFDPRVAIVTGAGRGIGRACALGLAGRGVAVCLAARRLPDLVAVEDRIRSLGGRGLAMPADVCVEEQVDKLVEETESRLGPVDLLVNNAGIVERSSIVEMDSTAWDRVLASNLKGPFLATRSVLRRMIPRRRGRIVNVSSISGKLGTPELSAYCASKWGLLGFTRAAAEELREKGIQVFSVSPGSVNTEMLRKGLPGAEPRMEPEEVAAVIVFLGMDAPDAMTGADLEVFG